MKTFEEAFNESYPHGITQGALNEAFKEVFQKGYESRDALIEELMDRIKILEEDAIRASIESACRP